MPPFYPGPAYRVITPRLVIRCWDPTDAPLLKDAIDANIHHLLTFMPWAATEPQPLDQKIQMLRSWRAKFDLGQDFVYAIFNQAETQVLGGTGLHTRLGTDAREIGYWVHKDFINQGLATEVSAALTKVAFEIDQVSRVEIHCAVENVRSAAVPRKLGFTHDATLRRRSHLSDNLEHDGMVWSLFADEYPKTPAAHVQIQAFDALGRQIL